MSTDSFVPTSTPETYVSVILPLALPKEYTYAVPLEWVQLVQTGIRVEVQFGKNRQYSAVIYEVSHQKPENYTPKAILSILDEVPIVTKAQIELWRWMADYYACTLGEVMNAALPSGLKLASETKIVLSPLFEEHLEELDDKAGLIAEALSVRQELTIDEVQKIVQQKTVYPLIDQLLEKKIIYLQEELQQKYRVKTVDCVRLTSLYRTDSVRLREAFDRLEKATRQLEALVGWVQLSKQKSDITRKELCEVANVAPTVVKELEKKGIFEIYKKEVSRLNSYEEALITSSPLSSEQQAAVGALEAALMEKSVVLLHGVTGSGKTRVYIELIEKAMARGEQVLYLVPEITLTAQTISRLQRVFGDHIAVYHSKLNNAERVEIWNSTLNGRSIILAARSGMFLPYQKLGLIIVDEEHDPSFKQTDPSPRYNARDMAVLMGQRWGAKVILGTATPSVETYYNTQQGKYGLVEMKQRFGGLEMPKIRVVNLQVEQQKKRLHSHFSLALMDELKATLERGEQAILFQNRRGYAPMLRCDTCNWTAQCIHCDVSLTYHKHNHSLKCHYCGHQTKVPPACPACGSLKLTVKGFGTEKIEDELKILLPDARIARMDFDTVRSKNAHSMIIEDFEQKKLDILVGTQMVTKGLDFDNVAIVGVLSADHLLHFPDFRASERAFQLMTQVSGRAGRKHKQGTVLIQAFDTQHPVLAEVFNHDFDNFYRREILERQRFSYPPFYRLIKITLRHRKAETVQKASDFLAMEAKKRLNERVLGPVEPSVARVRGYYLMDILIKLEKKPRLLAETKRLLTEASNTLIKEVGMSNIKINLDVDPY